MLPNRSNHCLIFHRNRFDRRSDVVVFDSLVIEGFDSSILDVWPQLLFDKITCEARSSSSACRYHQIDSGKHR